MGQPVEKMKYLRAVALAEGVTVAACRVAAVLVDFPVKPGTPPDAWLYPKQETLAETTGLSDRSVRAGVEYLAKIGALETSGRRGRGRASEYRVCLEFWKHASDQTDNNRKHNVEKPEACRPKAGSTLPNHSKPSLRTLDNNPPQRPNRLADEDRERLVAKIKGFAFDADSAEGWADRLILGGADRAKFHSEMARISAAKLKAPFEKRRAFEEVGNALVKPLARTGLRVVATAKRPMDDTVLDFPPADPVERSTSIAHPTLKQREAAASAAAQPGADPHFCDQRVCISVQGVAR